MTNDHKNHACLQIEGSFNKSPPYQDLAVAKPTEEFCLSPMQVFNCAAHSGSFEASRNTFQKCTR